ncbi:MAG: hydroxyacylglutathione hydrolase family protein, partial [Candidatus Aureabacteria bacterium]|nr:hydroxyacylglutathione hydrolase family protein [Candidatus Auribacterota bacterium]
MDVGKIRGEVVTGTASGVGVIQLSVGGFDRNFSYLLQEQASGDAAIVDPCGDIRVIERAVRASPGLRPRYILLTHGHRDHSSGIAEAKLFFEAPVASHPLCAFRPDIPLNDHQRLPFGDIAIECLHAPGHTTDSVVYRLTDDSALFTGDTLFIDWCGYCEARSMFRTMREVLYPLADTLEVYPGHDYGRYPHRPLG